MRTWFILESWGGHPAGWVHKRDQTAAAAAAAAVSAAAAAAAAGRHPGPCRPLCAGRLEIFTDPSTDPYKSAATSTALLTAMKNRWAYSAALRVRLACLGRPACRWSVLCPLLRCYVHTHTPSPHPTPTHIHTPHPPPNPVPHPRKAGGATYNCDALVSQGIWRPCLFGNQLPLWLARQPQRRLLVRFCRQGDVA